MTVITILLTFHNNYISQAVSNNTFNVSSARKHATNCDKMRTFINFINKT